MLRSFGVFARQPVGFRQEASHFCKQLPTKLWVFGPFQLRDRMFEVVLQFTKVAISHRTKQVAPPMCSTPYSVSSMESLEARLSGRFRML